MTFHKQYIFLLIFSTFNQNIFAAEPGMTRSDSVDSWVDGVFSGTGAAKDHEARKQEFDQYYAKLKKNTAEVRKYNEERIQSYSPSTKTDQINNTIENNDKPLTTDFFKNQREESQQPPKNYEISITFVSDDVKGLFNNKKKALKPDLVEIFSQNVAQLFAASENLTGEKQIYIINKVYENIKSTYQPSVLTSLIHRTVRFINKVRSPQAQLHTVFKQALSGDQQALAILTEEKMSETLNKLNSNEQEQIIKTLQEDSNHMIQSIIQKYSVNSDDGSDPTNILLTQQKLTKELTDAISICQTIIEQLKPLCKAYQTIMFTLDRANYNIIVNLIDRTQFTQSDIMLLTKINQEIAQNPTDKPNPATTKMINDFIENHSYIEFPKHYLTQKNFFKELALKLTTFTTTQFDERQNSYLKAVNDNFIGLNAQDELTRIDRFISVNHDIHFKNQLLHTALKNIVLHQDYTNIKVYQKLINLLLDKGARPTIHNLETAIIAYMYYFKTGYDKKTDSVLKPKSNQTFIDTILQWIKSFKIKATKEDQIKIQQEKLHGKILAQIILRMSNSIPESHLSPEDHDIISKLKNAYNL